MKRSDEPASISISVGGNNLGAIWSGNQNRVIINTKTGAATTLSPADIRELSAAMTSLRDQIAAQVPAAQRDAALQQVNRLQDAILPQPKIARMAEVRDWFIKNAPAVLGAVTAVFTNPIVGKIVEAAGEMAASAFRKRFGGT
ncbi:MAG TPA: hypothetical protein VMT95_11635 [Candidatus Binatia bacterium]|nr:hypothetical protein [Candidatus Binatia bacterium]